jgi:hypothetical protein
MALTLTPNEQIADLDYEVILSTIMETARGRRFLAEYARRARQSEIQTVLTEVTNLKRNCSEDLFDFTVLRALATNKQPSDT